jgi:DNA-binding PadR family transcriptional regulator
MRREIEERTGRPVSLGAIYPTMDRLEERGLVSSRMGPPTGKRGGRSRRYFRLEPAGEKALRDTRHMLAAMWEGYESMLGAER